MQELKKVWMCYIQDSDQCRATILACTDMVTDLVEHPHHGHGSGSGVLLLLDVIPFGTDIGEIKPDASTSAGDFVHILNSFANGLNRVLWVDHIAIK
jgi:hypothetical protein